MFQLESNSSSSSSPALNLTSASLHSRRQNTCSCLFTSPPSLRLLRAYETMRHTRAFGRWSCVRVELIDRASGGSHSLEHIKFERCESFRGGPFM